MALVARNPHHTASRSQLHLLVLAAFAAVTTVCVAQPVAAQITVSGTWRVSETSVDVNVEAWAAECGARPTSTRAKGGGLVTIEQKEQSQSLLLHGRDQDIRSDACWSRNPAIKRSLASYANSQWTTRCRTPEHEQLAEQGTYTLRLQDPNTLLYKDVSHYDWTLPDVKCIATYTTSQTFTRVEASDLANTAARGGKTQPEAATTSGARTGKAAASTTAAAATTTTTSPATAASTPATATSTTASGNCIPGAATRLSIRPRRAELEPGQRICFRPRLLDAEDCPVLASDVIWQLAHGSAAHATLNGSCFTATDAEGEGEYRIVAKRGSLQADVSVNVRHVDLSALIARRTDTEVQPAADDADDDDAFIAPKAATQIATHVATQAESGKRTRLGLGVGLGTCALVLVALGLWIRNNPRLRSQMLAEPALATAGAIVATPSEREPSHRVETSDPANAGDASNDTSMQQWICPTCRVGYPAQQTTCPKDGSTLVSYATFTERSKREEQEHGKRCPSCGKTYAASASFCGDDGVALESVPVAEETDSKSAST